MKHAAAYLSAIPFDAGSPPNNRGTDQGGDPYGSPCRYCHDTGRRPDWGGGWCSCPAGDLAKLRKRRVTEWQQIVPPRYRTLTHDGCPNPRLVAEVIAWREDRLWETEGQNLVLIGGTGCGKTAEAIAVSADIFLSTESLTWELVSAPRWLQEAHASNGRDELDRLSRVGLVVLDDLGAEARDTPFVRERLFALVDGRYVNQRPTIATSNHDLGTLARILGDRTISRLQHGARVVAVAGDDLRRR